MKKTIIIFMIMLLLCAVSALATVTYTLTAPANLYTTTSTSVKFEWNATSDETTQPAGMTTWLFINSNLSSDVPTQNESFLISNATWYNTTTLTGLDVGFHQWYLVTNDSDGNTTSVSRWFEVRESANESDFRWENETGFLAMKLNSDTGDLNVYGDLNISGSTIISSLGLTGNLEVNGTSTFNDAVIINSNLTVVGDVIVANVTEMDVNGSVLPGLDDTFDLGSSTLRWLSGYIRDLYVATFKSNVDFDSNNITGVTEITSTLVDTTNLEADNLESDLDGTGFLLTIGDVNGATWLNGTNVYTTNLFATNLESDIDATGYSITASTELASITGDFDNLEADNLESNLDGTGYNVTAYNLYANSTVVVNNNLTLDNDGTDSRITSLMGDLYMTSADDIRTDKDIVMGDDTINYELFSIDVNGTYAVVESFEDLDIYLKSSGNKVRVPTTTNITWDNGAMIGVNSTCLILTSPDGSGVFNVCDT